MIRQVLHNGRIGRFTFAVTRTGELYRLAVTWPDGIIAYYSRDANWIALQWLPLVQDHKFARRLTLDMLVAGFARCDNPHGRCISKITPPPLSKIDKVRIMLSRACLNRRRRIAGKAPIKFRPL